MDIVEVNIVSVQAFKATFHLAHDMVSGCASIVGAISRNGGDLGGQDYLVPLAFYTFSDVLLREGDRVKEDIPQQVEQPAFSD